MPYPIVNSIICWFLKKRKHQMELFLKYPIDVQEELPGIKLIAKPDYSQIGPDFGDKAPRIIAQLAIESPETILSHIEKDGKYELKAGNEKFNIVKEHLIVQRKVPEPYVEAMFKGGLVYLNKNLDKELQAEGFAREIMRRIQALRKNANLQKADKIELFIKAGNDLKEMLQKWEGMIKEKVNASSLEISSSKPEKKLKNYSKEKVREKEFELFLEKV